jgi:uncharacterized Fe-S cluster-containing protein
MGTIAHYQRILDFSTGILLSCCSIAGLSRFFLVKHKRKDVALASHTTRIVVACFGIAAEPRLGLVRLSC